jgi:hypothetical protein
VDVSVESVAAVSVGKSVGLVVGDGEGTGGAKVGRGIAGVMVGAERLQADTVRASSTTVTNARVLSWVRITIRLQRNII